MTAEGRKEAIDGDQTLVCPNCGRSLFGEEPAIHILCEACSCSQCGKELDEQVECSVCQTKACLDCSDASWDYIEELMHPNHRSGAICPSCTQQGDPSEAVPRDIRENGASGHEGRPDASRRDRCWIYLGVAPIF